MTNFPYVPPKCGEKAFHCPHCNAYSNQIWYGLIAQAPSHSNWRVEDLMIGLCVHCGRYTLWKSDNLLHPDSSQAPIPNPDLPGDIQQDYLEARSIISRSPRGAAALLRLCIQKLCVHLGGSGKNINDDIAFLVKQGLNPKIQKALDIVRVIGNESVHPGTIDLKDDPDTAVQLCNLINMIVETMITQPKEIDQLYQKLPEEKRLAIDKRDRK